MGTDIHAVFQARKDGKWTAVNTKWDQRRDYFLFAWLADVRNGFGFAYTRTHEPVRPLSSHRGFPDDFDADAHEIYDEDGDLYSDMGDHSFGWLSADEILNSKPPQPLATGIITVEQYRDWDGASPPSGGWCVGISGPAVVVADNPELITDQTTHVQVEWAMPDDRLDYFISEVRRLKEQHGDVRVVFGFDS